MLIRTTQNKSNTKLYKISVMLENFDRSCSNNVIIADNFSLFFSKKLECKGGDPYLKKHSVIMILETF